MTAQSMRLNSKCALAITVKWLYLTLMGKPIDDEFSALPVSRQYKYQLRHIRDGLCILCSHPAVSAMYCRHHTDLYLERQKRYLKRHPVKALAYKLVIKGLDNGTIKRQPCEVCGKTGQAHHEDYSKPLELRWLCNKHHLEVHGFTERIPRSIKYDTHEAWVAQRRVFKKKYRDEKKIRAPKQSVPA